MIIEQKVLTVTQLNRQVKSFLEHEIGLVHVEGELSNLSKPSSGHLYFTLKDSNAQVRCVFFKNRHHLAAKDLKDGSHIVASGRLSLYEARGDYQLIVEQITEAGLGALYQKFEELKNKLAAEGLFEQEKKRSLPPMPKAIGLITSPSGAAIKDILSTLERRFPIAPIYVYPSEVQGASASAQLIKALEKANQDNLCEVLILARGGGSIEDLWAFNDEALARKIASSTIPIVSGVGHETDFTIADFVADYRAETPTAAAVAVTPNRLDLLNMLNHHQSRLHTAIERMIVHRKIRLKHALDTIASPKKTIITFWQTLDSLERQMFLLMQHKLSGNKNQLALLTAQVQSHNPKKYIEKNHQQLKHILMVLNQQMNTRINQAKHQLNKNMASLHIVSPLATLDRGYSITMKEDKVLYSIEQVAIGDEVAVRLSKGSLRCEVLQKSE